MRIFSKIFLVLLILVSVLTLACIIVLYQWAYRSIILKYHTVDVTIVQGSAVRGVAKQLQKQGVILNADLFHWLAKIYRVGGQLQSGSYEFFSPISPFEILQKLVNGDVNQTAILLLEGWTFQKMREEINRSSDLKHDTLMLSDRALLQKIDVEAASAEGLFAPNTYFFQKGSSDLDIYQRAYHLMQAQLVTAWNARAPDLPYQTPYQALIMASLIEKETGRAEERPIIAAVFINRLRKSMLLQTDPSVIYGLGADYSGRLRKQDLQADTPYNTYLYAGLPPTPIALPSKAAIEAALNPSKTDALFFVAKGDGSSHFSNNLNDHNRAVNQYQRKLGQNKK